jgi:lipoyl synthase
MLEDVQPVNFYRPDYHIKTPEMRSPEYVQMSTAAAITLGLVPGMMHRTACTHCLNLLVTYPEGCRANCSYCGLARHRGGGARLCRSELHPGGLAYCPL